MNATMKIIWRGLLVMALVPALGCVESDMEEPVSADADVCAQASAHLSACMDQSMSLGAQCDVDSAQEVLAQDCTLLRNPGKADFVGDWLCKLGFLYHCSMPLCFLDDPLVEAMEAGHCEEFIGVDGCASCDYYLCREIRRDEPCGDRGYAMGFARHYCQLFTELTTERLSPRGQQWISDVRPCLQIALEEIDDDASCEETKRHGYESHPACYVDNGFCELPVTDMLAVLNTVAPQDLGVQPFVTGIECVKSWFNPETLELTEEGQEAIEAEASQR